MEKKILLQWNMQTLAQPKEEEQYYKEKLFQASTTQGKKMSIKLDYLDEDGTEVEAIEPTREIPKETNLRKVTVMTKV